MRLRMLDSKFNQHYFEIYLDCKLADLMTKYHDPRSVEIASLYETFLKRMGQDWTRKDNVIEDLNSQLT